MIVEIIREKEIIAGKLLGWTSDSNGARLYLQSPNGNKLTIKLPAKELIGIKKALTSGTAYFSIIL